MNIKNYKYITRHYYDDRLFSQIMRHLLSFFISKIDKITHIHKPYENNDININFDKIYNISNLIDETGDKYDIYKLYKDKVLYSAPDQNLVGLGIANKMNYYDINDIFSDIHIKQMRDNYKLNKVSDNYISSDINICLHIRRGDIIKYGKSCDRYTELEFFIDIIKKLQKILNNNCTFHVYSDSKVDLDIENCNIKYHIDDDLLITINEMINSNILIMSIGSNLSHFAGLHTTGIVFFDKNKLIPCFNNKYNIYWSNYKKFISNENEFIDKVCHDFNGTR